MSNNRIFTHDVEHFREDLRAALNSALPEPTVEEAQEIERVIAMIEDSESPCQRPHIQHILRQLPTIFSAAVFGAVVLYGLDNKVAFSGDAEVMIDGDRLIELGLRHKDLAWPADHPDTNPAFIESDDQRYTTGFELAASMGFTRQQCLVIEKNLVRYRSYFDQDLEFRRTHRDTNITRAQWDEIVAVTFPNGFSHVHFRLVRSSGIPLG